MNIESFIVFFDKVHRSGKEKEYICLCPAHNDKQASLSLKELSDGRILIHCFAGCSALNVLDAVGLEFSDIIPDKIGEFKPQTKSFNPYVVMGQVKKETLLVALAALELSKGNKLSQEDLDRLLLASDKLREAYELCH